MKKLLFTAVAAVTLAAAGCCPQDAPQAPKISNLTVTDVTGTVATYKFDLNVDATVYIFTRPATSPEPTVEQLKTEASSLISAGTGITKTVNPGIVNTSFTIYMVAENAFGTSSVVKVTFTTKS